MLKQNPTSLNPSKTPWQNFAIELLVDYPLQLFGAFISLAAFCLFCFKAVYPFHVTSYSCFVFIFSNPFSYLGQSTLVCP